MIEITIRIKEIRGEDGPIIRYCSTASDKGNGATDLESEFTEKFLIGMHKASRKAAIEAGSNKVVDVEPFLIKRWIKRDNESNDIRTT
jgi:hypothetical protein